jgi:hypothetical protein
MLVTTNLASLQPWRCAWPTGWRRLTASSIGPDRVEGDVLQVWPRDRKLIPTRARRREHATTRYSSASPMAAFYAATLVRIAEPRKPRMGHDRPNVRLFDASGNTSAAAALGANLDLAS